LTKTGGGTLAFTGSSTTKITFTGGLDMQEGTWIASQNSSSLPASGRVNFTNASGTNAKITVNTAASIEALAGGNANSTIDGNSALTVTGAQNTTYGGTIGGSVALKLTGNGSLALSGTSTYTGATTVSAGTLLVTGALGATHVTVNSGAFGGSGTVGGALDMAGGSLHVANLLNPLDVTGTVTIYSGFGIDDLAGLNWGSVANGTYTLINGTLGSGVFAALANNSPATAYNLGGGRSAYFEQGSLDLVVIPEPRAALLGGLALLGLLRRRR
jgi:autotransporter-associated beta strand protein